MEYFEYRCIWCMKDTKTNPCEFCSSDQVYIKVEKHNCHWSRNTIDTMICKICDKIISNKDYFAGNFL